MITVEEHLSRILGAAAPLPVERVPLAEAHGRCLAGALEARFQVPPWTNSAMDGYAARFGDVAAASADAPVELKVVADLPAGTSLKPAIGPGEAVRIMTGAPVPPDADTVIPVELTDGGTPVVRITAKPGEKRHIRRAGEDRRPGDPVTADGIAATPEVISSLASAGYGEVAVRQRPRVAVIATGDELVEPGVELAYGRIPDSNSLLVAGLVREAGGELVAVARVGDAADELAARLEELAGRTDLLILTGGVSVGAFDPVKALFAGGDEIRFDRVRMQPGKPQAFGRLGSGPLLFGLPGNPVSVWISFHVFVKPCLRTMLGSARVIDVPVPATALAGWRAAGERTQYLPAALGYRDGARTVAPAAKGGSGSHLVASLAAANGYATVPGGTGEVRVGERVVTVRTGPDDPDPSETGESRS